MRKLLIIFLTAIIAISGCAQKIDLEAEKAKIQSVLDQWSQAVETEDIESLSEIFAHDADMVIFVATASEHYVGWKQWKEALQKWFDAIEDYEFSSRERLIKVSASGNVAWISEIIDEKWVVQGEFVSMEGMRSTCILEKRDGNWVVVQFHASVPMAEEQAEN